MRLGLCLVCEYGVAAFCKGCPRGVLEDVPAPPHWGGYLIAPEVVEFWQGRENRVHNRVLLSGGRVARLQP